MQFPAFDPIALRIPFVGLEIRWYGLMYVLSFILAYLLLPVQARRQKVKLSADDVSDLIFYLILGVLLGGRLGYILFYNLQQYLANPLEILAIWHGGMSFHGGLIGVFLGTWYFIRKKGINFWRLADLIAPIAPLGLFFGRIGNFINGELWGRPTDVAWGMVFPMDPTQLLRHPSQLYEAFFEGLVLFVVLWNVAKIKRRPSGLLPGLFVVGYGVFRFFIEFYREPDAQLGLFFGWISMGQMLCLAMILVGLGLIAYVAKTRPSALEAEAADEAAAVSLAKGETPEANDGPAPDSGSSAAPEA